MSNKLDYNTWCVADQYVPAYIPHPAAVKEREIVNIVYRDPLTDKIEYRTSFKHFIDSGRISIWIYSAETNALIKKSYISAKAYSMDVKIFAYNMMEKLSQESITRADQIAKKAKKSLQAKKSAIALKRIYSLYLNKLEAKHNCLYSDRFTDGMKDKIRLEIAELIDNFKSKYGADLL